MSVRRVKYLLQIMTKNLKLVHFTNEIELIFKDFDSIAFVSRSYFHLRVM